MWTMTKNELRQPYSLLGIILGKSEIFKKLTTWTKNSRERTMNWIGAINNCDTPKQWGNRHYGVVLDMKSRREKSQ